MVSDSSNLIVRAFISGDNTAAITCPKCQKTIIKDVSRYTGADNMIKLKARCPCGNSFTVFLERRKQYRKTVELRGTYLYTPSCGASKIGQYWGSMIVTDISRTGIRMKVSVQPRLKVGDRITVEFNLDDAKNSLIKRDVIVQHIKGMEVGATYAMSQSYDNIIGFYLLK
jgi:hypothetical protein